MVLMIRPKGTQHEWIHQPKITPLSFAEELRDKEATWRSQISAVSCNPRNLNLVIFNQQLIDSSGWCWDLSSPETLTKRTNHYILLGDISNRKFWNLDPDHQPTIALPSSLLKNNYRESSKPTFLQINHWIPLIDHHIFVQRPFKAAGLPPLHCTEDASDVGWRREAAPFVAWHQFGFKFPCHFVYLVV